MNKITLRVLERMDKNSEEYLQFKTLIRELEQVIKRQAPARKENTNIIPYTRREVEMTRQQFNTLFNQIKSLSLQLCYRQSLSPSATEDIQACFSDMQYMFFAKNDVNFSIST